MSEIDAARLAAYEKTGLTPEEIQEVVDMFKRELNASDAEIPAETKSWMKRCTWHVRKCAELEKENERLRRFKAYWDMDRRTKNPPALAVGSVNKGELQ